MKQGREIVVKTAQSPLTWLLLAAGAMFAFKKADKAIDYNKDSKQNEEAEIDPNVNLANQIWDERKDYVVTDSVIISLFREISDYNKVKAAYKIASGGKDLLLDLQPYVAASTFQKMQEIIGVKGGAKTTTSKTSTDLINLIKERVKAKNYTAIYIIANSEVRIRKTPVKTNVYEDFTNRSNIIRTAKPGLVVGAVNINEIAKNGYRFSYDDVNKVWFIPVRAADAKLKWQKEWPVYVAASEVSFFNKPIVGTDKKIMLIDAETYSKAKSASLNGGIEKTKSINVL